MEIINLLDFTDRIELREWLKVNHNRVKSCWVVTSRSKQPTYECIPYIEVVEEALCFRWIDSTLKKLPDGCLAQRLSPHRKGSHWTELNKERCINLEDRGLMTDAGHQAFEKAYSYEIVPKGSLMEEKPHSLISRASYRTENHFYNRKPPFGKSHRYLSNSRKETVFVPVASPPSLQSAHVAATTFAPQ